MLFVGSALSSSAALQIQIDTLTTDTVTLTIFGGPGSTFSGAPTHSLEFVDFSSGAGVQWLNFVPSGTSILLNSPTNTGNSISYLSALVDPSGDGLFLVGLDPFVAGDYFTSNVQLTWTGTNAFDLGAIGGSIFAFWGTDVTTEIATGVLQDTVAAAAIPEPTTVSLLIGLGAIVATLALRRQHLSKMAAVA